VQLDVSERECEVLEDVLRRSLGDLRAALDTACIGDPAEEALEQREMRLGRLLTRVAARRAGWRAESAALDGLIGPERSW